MLIHYTTDCALGLYAVEVEMHKTASSFGDDSRGSDTLPAYFQEYQVAVAVAHLPTKPVFVVVHHRRDASSIIRMPIPQKLLLLAIQKMHIYGNTTQYRRFSEALKWSHGHICPRQYLSMHLCVSFQFFLCRYGV